MFAHFVCALLSFRAHSFTKKSRTQELGKIIVECTRMNYITSGRIHDPKARNSKNLGYFQNEKKGKMWI